MAKKTNKKKTYYQLIVFQQLDDEMCVLRRGCCCATRAAKLTSAKLKLTRTRKTRATAADVLTWKWKRVAVPRGGSAAVRPRLYNLITCLEVAGGTAAYRLPGKAVYFALERNPK